MKKNNLNFAIIDIGSNSVRIMYADGNFYNKQLITTRLGEGLHSSGMLSSVAINRTVEALKTLYKRAISLGYEKVYAFATASVREAVNGADFCRIVKEQVGITIEVISGDDEALLGILGAVKGSEGGIIDIGGASSEVAYKVGGQVVYEHSLKLGAVKVFDECGKDFNKCRDFISSAVSKYPEFDGGNKTFYAIGGTATSLASIILNLKEYNPLEVDGLVITFEKLNKTLNALFSMSSEEISLKYAVDYKRAEIIAGGALILSHIMSKFNLDKVVVSEGDNLEGYAIYRGLV